MLNLVEPADQMVAVLHDAVEDTELELRHLVEKGYDPEVVEAVDAITHRDGESYDEYIERLATNEIARRVKVADLQENLANNQRLAPSPAVAERIDRYKRAMARLASSS